MSHLVLLDNEAVQALAAPGHPKHRRVLSHIQVVARRKRRGMAVRVEVPTTVRVEAGWVRSAPTWALASRLRIADAVLDGDHADVAAQIRREVAVSVTDAHLGAAMRSTSAARVTVITSDPADMRAVAGTTSVTVVTI